MANNNIFKFSVFKVIVWMQIFKEMQTKILFLVMRRQRLKRKIPFATQAIEKWILIYSLDGENENWYIFSME